MAVDAGTIYAEVRVEVDKIKGDLAKLSTNFNTFAKNNQTNAEQTQKSWSDGFKKINLAGVAAFAGISLAVKGAVGQFAEFEQSIANVQSVARATPEEFEKLEAAARAAGETTKFSATEAADALYSLASAGLDATESAAALDGVLKLAGATGSDLAFTSATVTSALSQFSLSADKAVDVANVFAAAIGNSQANMQKLSTAMRQVGPVAGSFGLSIEQTIGPLQALFDAGFQGEQAGTALRNILSSLANEADPTVKKLEALGFAFEDLNPAVNSVVDIVGTLNNSNIEAGQVIAAFGKEAGPQLLSLLKVGTAGLKEYEKAVTGTQAASEAYEIQMNTMQGGFAEMRSALESVSISFVQEFAPAINFVVDLLTKLLRFVSGLPGPLKVFLGVLTVGIPIISGLGVAITSLVGIVGSLLGPISLAVLGVAGLTAGIVALTDNTSKLDKLENDLKETTDKLSKSVGDYEEVTRQLETALKNGNIEEAKTLKLRQDLLKTQIASNLKNTLKVIKDLTKEQGKQNKVLSTLQSEYDNVISFSKKYERALQDEIMRGQANSETAAYYRNELKGVAIQVQDVTERLTDQKVATQESNLARQQAIDGLAEYLNSGQIQLAQIKLYNSALAEEILLRSKELAASKEAVKEKEKEAAATKKANDESEKKAGLDTKEAERQKKLKEENEKKAAAIKKANEEIEKVTEKYRQSLEDLNATELESIELARKRAIEEVNSSKATQSVKQKAIEAINRHHDALIEESGAYKDISDQTEAYEMQLLRLVGTEQEIIEAERNRAVAVAETSGATEEAIEAQIKLINKLYDEMQKASEETAEKRESDLEKWVDDNKKYIDVALNAFTNFTSAIDDLFTAMAEKDIERINEKLNTELSAIDERLQAELAAAGLSEETRIESLEKQLAEAISAGESEKAEKLKNEIQKLKIEQKYADERAAVEDAARKKSADLEYKAALLSWKIQIAQAIAAAALSIANIWGEWGENPIVAGVLTGVSAAATGIQIAAIAQAKPEPPSLATGGIVIPAGADGRQVTMAENGAPELALNAGGEGAALLDLFASRLSRSMGSTGGQQNMQIVLMMDTKRVAQATAKYYNNGQVPLILEI